MKDFIQAGKASFLLGAQFGSEGKGAAAAWLVARDGITSGVEPDNVIVTTNAGSQSGHTSVHNGRKRVLFHLPTSAVVWHDNGFTPRIYLNGGAIIDPQVLEQELKDTGLDDGEHFFIHPNAAVITQECKDAEGRNDSAQTKIASTRKGVGEALSRKVLRSGQIARDHPYLKQFVRRIDLNDRLRAGYAVLAEVPQGFSLGIDQPFYPHTTSRNCTVMQAMSDAGIHPEFYGQSMLVVRTYPIRVGNIESPVGLRHAGTGENIPVDPIGHSGGAYPGQRELSWEQLGQPAEITTVTKRVRRVFEFSQRQLIEAMAAARPTVVFLAFCDYLKTNAEQDRMTRTIHEAAKVAGLLRSPGIIYAYGPSTVDAQANVSRLLLEEPHAQGAG